MNDELLQANERAAIAAGMCYDQAKGWFKPEAIQRRLVGSGPNTSTRHGIEYINSTDLNNTHGTVKR